MKKTGITLFCMFLSIVAFAQLKAIKGSIIDETGEPVIGASILVKGTATGTTTDVDGRFSLTVATGKILVISYIGYDVISKFKSINFWQSKSISLFSSLSFIALV